MTKFEEELMATAKMIPTSDGNEIKFKTSSALYDYLVLSNGEAELYLQQQALPVVPECVAEWIEHCKGMGYGLIAALTFKLSSTMHEELSAKILKWLGNERNDETFALAFITGKYQVEKPQLFYLKEKNFGYYIANEEMPGVDSPTCMYIENAEKFTQQEIDSMQTGSYEQIEVAE